MATDGAPAPAPGARLPAPDRRAAGLTLAIASSCAFALSGSLARGLFDTGWSPGAVVLIRITIGALVVLPLGVASVAGRWSVVWRNAGLIVV